MSDSTAGPFGCTCGEKTAGKPLCPVHSSLVTRLFVPQQPVINPPALLLTVVAALIEKDQQIKAQQVHIRELEGRNRKLVDGIADIQRHRDAWRSWAYQRGLRPNDFLDGLLCPDSRTETWEDRAVKAESERDAALAHSQSVEEFISGADRLSRGAELWRTESGWTARWYINSTPFSYVGGTLRELLGNLCDALDRGERQGEMMKRCE